MHFKIGERITFLHDTGYGLIRKFGPNDLVQVEDETGFLRPFPISELVKIHRDQSTVSVGDNANFLSEEQMSDRANNSAFEHVTKKKGFWEIDLHTHEILDSEAGMEPAELLRHQLSVFRTFMRSAREKHIKKLVIIHGVGAGVLKHEVRKYLSAQDDCTHYDADFREYGKGATEVEIFYNGKPK